MAGRRARTRSGRRRRTRGRRPPRPLDQSALWKRVRICSGSVTAVERFRSVLPLKAIRVDCIVTLRSRSACLSESKSTTNRTASLKAGSLVNVSTIGCCARQFGHHDAVTNTIMGLPASWACSSACLLYFDTGPAEVTIGVESARATRSATKRVMGPPAGLGRGLIGRALSAEHLQQSLLQLGGHSRCGQLAGGGDRGFVGVHEGDAGGAAVDVPFEELDGALRQRPVEVVAEKLGDLPTLDLGRARAATALGHRHRL